MDSRLVLNAMTTRADRALAGLQGDAAKIDGRSFEDLLRFGTEFAGLVTYYDLENEPCGDWTAFFSAHPAAVMAAILAIDTDRFERKAPGRGDAPDAEPASAPSQGLSDDVGALARLWRQAKGGLDGQPGMAGLASELEELFQSEDLADGADPERQCRCIRRMQALVRPWFEQSLSSDRHHPQLSLFMAFCKLFGFAQATANTIPDRLVEFYYRDVVRFSDRPARADEVLLTFRLADDEGMRSSLVPAGTQFPTGTDALEQDITFAADKAIGVTTCAVGKVRALRVVDAPLGTELHEPAEAENSAEPERDEAGPHRHHHHHHHHPELDRNVRSVVVATEKPGGWIDAPADATAPLFGASAPQLAGGYASWLARFGFAVSSEVLALSGGTRTIGLTLEGSLSRDDPPARESLKTLARCSGLSEREVLELLIGGGFRFALSTAEGWQECAVEAVSAQVGSTVTATITFVLDPDFPEIAPLPAEDDTQAGEKAATPRRPALRALLRQEPVEIPAGKRKIETYPFAILEGFAVDQIAIDVSVKELPVTALSNSDGEIDPANPFTVFGGEQPKGSFLDLHCPELFAKSVTELGLQIDWFALPANDTGFAGYYQYYTIDPAGNRLDPRYDNDVFECKLSVTDPGPWDLEGAAAGKRLLYTTLLASAQDHLEETADDGASSGPPEPAVIIPAGGTLAPSTIYHDIMTTASPTPPPPHYSPDQSALRITLAEPQYGYGFQLYTPNVLKAALAELPEGDETREERCQAECEKLHPVWGDAITVLERGVIDGEGQKFLSYYEAILPSITEAAFDLLAAFWACLKEKALPPPDPAIARIARQLGSFERAAHKNSRRNRIMLDTLRDWRAVVERGRLEDQGDNEECWQYLLGVLEIDIALAATLAEGFTRPEDHYPANIAPVIDLFAANRERVLKPCCEECLKIKYPAGPYVPQASAILLSYSAAAYGPRQSDSINSVALVHIHPFGEETPAPLGEHESVSLLPDFDFEGALFLGLADPLRGTPQTFLVALGDPAIFDPIAELPDPEWSALTGAGWTRLAGGSVVRDGSLGLQQTGIVELELPSALAIDPGAEGDGRAGWLRASVHSHAADFPWLRAVLANAGTARRIPLENGILPYDSPIPPGTITESAEEFGDIGEIFQPLASFGGKPAQIGQRARTANAERLRHKDRAIAPWDYEALVLENFPSIAGVRVVPAFEPKTDDRDKEDARSGNVLVVVLSGPQPGESDDPTVPMAPASVLGAIRELLARRASAFANIIVSNPPYVRLQVTARVRFRSASDSGANIDRLNAELIAFLSPGSQPGKRNPALQYWRESEIADFIVTRDYVEELRSFSVGEVSEGESAQHGLAFFTSAREHCITEAADLLPAGEAR